MYAYRWFEKIRHTTIYGKLYKKGVLTKAVNISHLNINVLMHHIAYLLSKQISVAQNNRYIFRNKPQEDDTIRDVSDIYEVVASYTEMLMLLGINELKTKNFMQYLLDNFTKLKAVSHKKNYNNEYFYIEEKINEMKKYII